MFVLDTTTRTLEVLLDAAPATSQLPVVVTYADVDFAGASPHTLASSNTVTNGTTAVTAAAAPASGVKRQVEQFYVRNDDTATRVVKLRYNDNGTLRNILWPTLLTGEALQYTHADGLCTLATDGSKKVTWTAPSISQGGGFVRINTDGSVEVSPASSKNTTIDSGDLVLPSANRLAWSTDLFLQRDGAGILSLRNGTNAQESRVYRTWTDASNGEWFGARWNGLTLELGSFANGTGDVRAVNLIGSFVGVGVAPTHALEVMPVSGGAPAIHVDRFGAGSAAGVWWGFGIDNPAANDAVFFAYSSSAFSTGGFAPWVGDGNAFLYFPARFRIGTGVGTAPLLDMSSGAVGFGGNLVAFTDNTYDVGASGATRPRNGYFSGGVAVKVKAGTPADADFTGPVDGMIAVDSTASKIWVRIGGTWKGVTVT